MAKNARKAMKTLTKKAKKVSKPKRLTLMDTLPNSREEWLVLVINMTKKHVKGPNDHTFDAQLLRLETELAEIRKAQMN